MTADGSPRSEPPARDREPSTTGATATETTATAGTTPSTETTVTTATKLSARLAPIDVEPSDDLRRPLGYLGADVEARTVVRAGYGAGSIVAVVVGVVATIATSRPLLPVSVALAAAAVLAHVVHRAPIWLAAVHRTRSLSAASGLIGRAVLRLRIEPAPERAAAFAAASDDGPLAESLAGHVRRARGTPRSGLKRFADEWRPRFPALERATTLLRTAATAPAERRDRVLDRALDVVVDGTKDRLAAFVGDVRGPVTGLYAFGVLLPLALVALLPAGRVAGAPITLGLVVVVYDLLLPAGLVVAGGWLLVRRPVAFPPPRVPRSHPDVPTRRWPALAAGVVVGVVAGCGAGVLLPNWTAPLAGVGAGIGTALLAFAAPRRRVHERVRDVESGLPDALTLVGGRVADGASVESAVADAGELVEGATGEYFADAARRSRTLRVGVETAFNGRDGALRDLPSPRARGAAALLGIAAREGRPAGDVLLDLADQLESLAALERDARRELATVTGTLKNTAAVFAPLVGGATVALAAGMDPAGVGTLDAPAATIGHADPGSERTAATRGDPLPTAALGLAVGAYVLLLAVLLTALATALERGLDPTLVALRVGVALSSATATYLLAFVGAGLLL